MNLKKYTTMKNISRHINNSNAGLGTIYRFMSNEEQALLASHVSTITFNDDVRDCAAIRDKYSLSWNEIRFIIKRFCRK